MVNFQEFQISHFQISHFRNDGVTRKIQNARKKSDASEKSEASEFRDAQFLGWPETRVFILLTTILNLMKMAESFPPFFFFFHYDFLYPIKDRIHHFSNSEFVHLHMLSIWLTLYSIDTSTTDSF